jgi:signal transduction histidine kinase
MERVLKEREGFRPRRLDVILTFTVAGMLLVTGALLADPELNFVIFDRSLDVAVQSLGALAAASLAALGLVRFRETGRTSGLLQSSAYVLLATVAASMVVLVLLKLDGRLGLTLGLPEQLPLYAWAISRLTTAGLLLAGGVAAVRAMRGRPTRVRRLLVAPIAVVAIGTALLWPFREMLPPLIDEQGIQALIEDPRSAAQLPGVTGLGVLLAATSAVLLITAAALYRWSYLRRRGPITDAFLSIGLVIAAFSELHFVLYPGVYSGLVTTGDALRLAFFLVLLVGLDAEARSDLRALRTAYAALDRLRVNEAERAALEERNRLAREIHDGLAQHLWFAKLKHERLAAQLPEDVRELSTEVGQALDTAIVEARQALVTMRAPLDHALPLSDLLARTVDDFGQRSGLRVEFAAPTLSSDVPARQQAELLRVVQEALTNVRKHADATVVRVTAEIDDGDLLVTVTDNGRGFRPDEVKGSGLGLRGMAERARLLGGHLGISSEPSDGTLVTLRLPLDAPANGARANGSTAGEAAVREVGATGVR